MLQCYKSGGGPEKRQNWRQVTVEWPLHLKPGQLYKFLHSLGPINLDQNEIGRSKLDQINFAPFQ